MLALVLGLLASACTTGSSPKEGEFTGTRLETPYEPADIALTDTTGEDYSLVADTDKPLTLVFFGYTKCPDFCPLVMNNIAAAMNRLDDADSSAVDMVFVTTDPTTDTTGVLRTYLDRYNDSFIGLTLGALGGGGSVLTLPILVFVAGIPAQEAVAMSMVVNQPLTFVTARRLPERSRPRMNSSAACRPR